MNYTLIKTGNQYLLLGDRCKPEITKNWIKMSEELPYEILASTEPIKHIPLLEFTPEVASELGIVDLDKLAEFSSERQEATYTVQHKVTYQHGFIDGYRYHKEQTKDKLYTREDMDRCWEQAIQTVTGADDFPMGGNTFKYPTKDEYISQLHSQQWNVEIEMEEYALPMPNIHVKEYRPKITNNTITITKILKP